MNPIHAKHPAPAAQKQGVGASVLRKEDLRLMKGRGQFVGDLKLAGMWDVAFARSPVAHGRLKGIEKPAGHESVVFAMDDLPDVKPIRAVSGLPGFKTSEQWPLARGKVRQVGELLAACVAPTRAAAEDLAQAVFADIEALPAVVDMVGARTSPSALVHEAWGDNVFLETRVDDDLTSMADAPIKITRHIRTARQCMSPLEGRGVVCQWDSRLEQLTMWSSAQMVHINRQGLSECLGLDTGQIRVIAPDVGGGFGYKGILLPEEIVLAKLAMQLQRPLRWIEDRREQLTANANCREHDYDITVYAQRDGRLLGIDCEATVDSGAYSSYPFSACLEAAQVSSILPGPYKMERYRCKTWSVATNKPPILPYRGVARTGVCFALELMVDAIAREAGMEPIDVRLANVVQPKEMPYDNITKKHFDSGDYPRVLKLARDAIRLDAIRDRQSRGEADGRRIGVGFAIYCEQAAHGTSVYFGWGIPMVPGHEQCRARMNADGVLELAIGAHSHGQGMETTLAQVAHEVLGISVDKVRLSHGDTAHSPYSTGTWGSRSMVMSGGAVAAACKTMAKRVKHIASRLLDCEEARLHLSQGMVYEGDMARLSLAEIAHTWHRAPQLLPADIDPAGLEVIAGYKAARDTGTFSYACHAVAVAVDTELGAVELLDYVIAEDGGVLVNPMVVDGQIMGGTAQGIGTALYEEMPFDANGQPLASTLADYMLPGAPEVPSMRIAHIETPSPYTEFGQKGIGEGGAIAPPAAIVNAINDALKDMGVEITESPVSPRRLLAAINAARSAAKSVGKGGAKAHA
jgi:carbon-monoxide dehydrogenase large subunit